MMKIILKIFLVFTILSTAVACSSVKEVNENTKLFSKDVVYHAYSSGGDYSYQSFNDDYGYLFNSVNLLEWSKSGDQEQTRIVGEYKISSDGHIWIKSNDGYSTKYVLWGEITEGVLEVYEASSRSRTWYITEDYYHNVVLGK